MAWLADLHDELLEAAGRQHRRRVRRRRVLVAAGLLPVLVLAALVLQRPEQAEASSVAVSRVPGGFEIDLIDRDAPPRTVADDLAAKGVVVQLEEVTTGPSRVGRLLWLRAASSQAPDGELFVPDGAVVRVGVGQQAPAGLPYELRSDAFAAGEVLHCVGYRGQRAGELAGELASRPGISVTWRAVDGSPTPVGPDDARVVSSAEAVAARAVEVFVDPDPVAVEDPCR